MTMEHWWNDTDRENINTGCDNLPQCYSVHHKSHTDWFGIELEFL